VRKILLASVLAASVLTPRANAAGDAGYVGGCGYDAGVVYTATAVFSTTQKDNPVPAQVRCTVYDSFFETQVGSAEFGGTGVVAGADLLPVTAAPVWVCISVAYGTGDAADEHCTFALDGEAYASELAWSAQQLRYDLEEDEADPRLCPVLQTLDPHVAGDVIEVQDDGDVVVLGAGLHDCPPYGD